MVAGSGIVKAAIATNLARAQTLTATAIGIATILYRRAGVQR
jgi:hypothetical protein